MRILMAVDGGEMQRRVCGANAAASLEGMLLCPADESAQVSRASGVVDMAALVMSTLTGEQAIAEATSALVVRVDNVYEVEGEFFSVDARADWSRTTFGVIVRDAPDSVPQCTVAAYVAHLAGEDVSGSQRMRGGHYVAYVLSGGAWFEFDDEVVRSLEVPPTRFPYLLFLYRADVRCRLRLSGKQSVGTVGKLLLSRASSTAGAAGWGSGARGDPPPPGRGRQQDRVERQQDRAGRQRDETGRQRDRAGRQRDETGRQRDQTGQQRDQTGRRQDRVGRDQTHGCDDRVRQVWGSRSSGDNRDHSRSDALNNLDHPFQRYKEAWPRRREAEAVSVKRFCQRAGPILPQPCRLCQQEFCTREDFVRHVNDKHGGLQRYRNALFSMVSLQPYAIQGQEWRAVQASSCTS